ncbi:MAG: hypothetical protein AB8F78_05385 [Saprospiraceae bacterium]
MPKFALLGLGVLCLVLSSCSSTKRGLSSTEVINQIIGNECASSRLDDTHMLVTLWSPKDTTFINYPAETKTGLSPETPVQIGGLTSSFLVPVMLNKLYSLGLSLDSTAIPVYTRAGRHVRNISFGQLLTHHSNLPVYSPSNDGDALNHLLVLDDLLGKQPKEEITNEYRFTHWNYTLAAEAIRAKQNGIPELRPTLAYSDRLPDSVRTALAVTQARVRAPRENQHPDLFALSTAGIASTHELIALLDSLHTSEVGSLQALNTFKDRPNTKVIPGWYKISLKNGQHVYLNGGRTRRHSASMVYYPYTETGVIAVATDSKQLDCLVMDILRNLNENWKRKPSSNE